MTKPVLYFWDESPPARTALFMIRYLNLDVEIFRVPVDGFPTPEYVKMNPHRKVPTLVDGDFVVTESTAVIQYLYEKSGSKEPLYGVGLQERARVTSRLCFNTTGLFQKLLQIAQPLYDKKTDKIEEAHRQEIWREYDVLNQLLGGYKFAAADYPTVADFGLAASVVSLKEMGFDTQKYPNITNWLKNCEVIPGFDENLKGSQMLGSDIRKFAPGSFQ